jgi:23S rRNA pseudouridine1911/1915/1917 synthase
LARDYIKQKYAKPGNVFLGVVSRLDAPVTGIVLFARTSKAAGRLSRIYRERSVVKEYWAVVSGAVDPDRSEWTDWVSKNERAHKMVVSVPTVPHAQEARLRYAVQRFITSPGSKHRTLLKIELLTGRKHQIRVQMSHHGYPIVGDAKYGSRETFAGGIALHARRLAFEHPVKKTLIDLTAPWPRSWRRWGMEER